MTNRQRVNIYYVREGAGFRWAWEESKDKNVWGHAPSVEEIKERASKMFLGMELELTLL